MQRLLSAQASYYNENTIWVIFTILLVAIVALVSINVVSKVLSDRKKK